MLLAARLAKYTPLLITRTSDQSERIRRQGLELTEGTQRECFSIRSMDATSCQSGLANGTLEQADCILLTAKQTHLDEALLTLLRSALQPDGLLVCYQNGMGHIELLSHALNAPCIAAAVTTEGARKTSSSSVIHTGRGSTKLGMIEPGRSHSTQKGHDRLVIVEQCLNEAGFVTSMSNEITADIWNKLVINCVINPLTAYYGLYNGELLQSPFLLRVMRMLYEEAVQVADKEAIRVDPELWDTLIEVCNKTAGNRSSMLQDIDFNRPTELEWMTGSLLRAAEKGAIRLPTHEELYYALSGSVHSR
jgi:2-dehydropantoate 2-reductase